MPKIIIDLTDEDYTRAQNKMPLCYNSLTSRLYAAVATGKEIPKDWVEDMEKEEFVHIDELCDLIMDTGNIEEDIER